MSIRGAFAITASHHGRVVAVAAGVRPRIQWQGFGYLRLGWLWFRHGRFLLHRLRDSGRYRGGLLVAVRLLARRLGRQRSPGRPCRGIALILGDQARTEARPVNCWPATRAQPRICPRKPECQVSNDQLREPPKTFGVPPQKSHKSASRAAPTDIPQTRRHSAAHPGTRAKIGTKTSPEQAQRRCRRLSAVPIGGGQGQDRTVDLPLFRRSIVLRSMSSRLNS